LARTYFVAGTGAFVQCISASDQNDTVFAVGSQPVLAMASGDVVGWPPTGIPDGVPDLLVANPSTSEVIAFQRNTALGNAYGLLLLPELIEVDETFFQFETHDTEEIVTVEALATGDLDLDGDLDIAFRGSDGFGRVIGWQFDNRICRASFMPRMSDTLYAPSGGSFQATTTWSGNAPAQATHLHITVFEHNASNSALLTSPILQGTATTQEVLISTSPTVPTVTTFNMPTTDPYKVYNVLYRAVRKQGTIVEKAWPSLILLHREHQSELLPLTWPEAAQALKERPVIGGEDGAGTHTGGTQSAGGRGTPPPPIAP
jgi:hypothetical protein